MQQQSPHRKAPANQRVLTHNLGNWAPLSIFTYKNDLSCLLAEFAHSLTIKSIQQILGETGSVGSQSEITRKRRWFSLFWSLHLLYMDYSKWLLQSLFTLNGMKQLLYWLNTIWINTGIHSAVFKALFSLLSLTTVTKKWSNSSVSSTQSQYQCKTRVNISWHYLNVTINIVLILKQRRELVLTD